MKIKDKAWSTFSTYIRLRDKATCYTCGTRHWDEELGEWSIKKMNAGHFKHNVLDFDEINIHCQCISCNHHKSGMLDVYAENLIRDYGIDEFQNLLNRAKQALRGEIRSQDEYRAIIEKYSQKIKKFSTIA